MFCECYVFIHYVGSVSLLLALSDNIIIVSDT